MRGCQDQKTYSRDSALILFLGNLFSTSTVIVFMKFMKFLPPQPVPVFGSFVLFASLFVH